MASGSEITPERSECTTARALRRSTSKPCRDSDEPPAAIPARQIRASGELGQRIRGETGSSQGGRGGGRGGRAWRMGWKGRHLQGH